MRKLLSLVVVALMCATAQAQIVESSSVSFKRTKKEPSTTTWFLRAGLNMATITDDVDRNLGYQAVVGFQKPMTSFGLYWGMDFGLGTRGFKESYNDEEISLLTHNVQVSPFNIGWKYNVVGDLAVDLHLGAFALYDYAGKYKYSYEGVEESYGLGDIEGFQRFDAGLNAGFGIWYGRFNLDFTFQRGFVPSGEDVEGENNDDFTNNFMIRLGVAF